MIRNSLWRALKAAALPLAAFFLVAGAVARHRSASNDEPGVFDYYLLSLSWSPAFCLSDPGAAECTGPRGFGFIVHGLWPQNERGWPEKCNVHLPVPDRVVTEMSDLMPAPGLIYHEWSTHGTCSGLDPADYFALVRRAYSSIVIPAPLASGRQSIEESPVALIAAFVRANPKLPVESMVVTCSGQEVARLREVHICLDRTSLRPRACSPDAARQACRASTLIVPPVR